MSIQSAKGVEIGDAIASSSKRGSSVHDEILHSDERGYHRETDRAGGLEGGITNGEDLVVRTIWKPLPTLMRPLRSVEMGSHTPREAHVERSDVTVLPAAAVVAEAGVAFELARAALEKFGGDAIGDFVASHAAYLERIARHDSRPSPKPGADRVHGRGQDHHRNAPGQRLGWRFFDADVEIESEATKPIGAIFRDDGEGAFRALEERVIARLLDETNAVIAVVGGAVTSAITLRAAARQQLHRVPGRVRPGGMAQGRRAGR